MRNKKISNFSQKHLDKATRRWYNNKVAWQRTFDRKQTKKETQKTKKKKKKKQKEPVITLRDTQRIQWRQHNKCQRTLCVKRASKLWKWFQLERVKIQIFREFDPGSGRTLAACLTHASRTEILQMKSSVGFSNILVADGWVTRE